jgi:hypothetical protein
MFNGRRQPSCDGTSRMTRECQVRICERLGVKFPGPTRPLLTKSNWAACPQLAEGDIRALNNRSGVDPIRTSGAALCCDALHR